MQLQKQKQMTKDACMNMLYTCEPVQGVLAAATRIPRSGEAQMKILH